MRNPLSIPRVPVRRTFVLLAMLCACAVARADISVLLDGTVEAGGAAARVRAALDLASELASVLRSIEAPAGTERRAVLDEYAAIERLRDQRAVNVRAHALYASTAFQHLRLHDALSAAHDALRCAAQARGATRREATCWAGAAAVLGDRDYLQDAVDVLSRSGRLPFGGVTPGMRWKTAPAWWAQYAIAIQRHILVPLLRENMQ